MAAPAERAAPPAPSRSAGAAAAAAAGGGSGGSRNGEVPTRKRWLLGAGLWWLVWLPSVRLKSGGEPGAFPKLGICTLWLYSVHSLPCTHIAVWRVCLFGCFFSHIFKSRIFFK